MQRLNKYAAEQTLTKLKSELSKALCRQVDVFIETLTTDGLVSVKTLHDELFPSNTPASANAALNRFITQLNTALATSKSAVRLNITADKKLGAAHRTVWLETDVQPLPKATASELARVESENNLEMEQRGISLTSDNRVVLLTFNPNELKQTIKVFCPDSTPVQVNEGDTLYYDLGTHNNLKVIQPPRTSLKDIK